MVSQHPSRCPRITRCRNARREDLRFQPETIDEEDIEASKAIMTAGARSQPDARVVACFLDEQVSSSRILVLPVVPLPGWDDLRVRMIPVGPYRTGGTSRRRHLLFTSRVIFGETPSAPTSPVCPSTVYSQLLGCVRRHAARARPNCPGGRKPGWRHPGPRHRAFRPGDDRRRRGRSAGCLQAISRSRTVT